MDFNFNNRFLDELATRYRFRKNFRQSKVTQQVTFIKRNYDNSPNPCFFPNFQLCIPALCSLSLIVSTLHFKPSAGATNLAAVRGCCVAIATIASSCSLVVIRRRPFLSFVCTLPSLCQRSSHLLTVRS